MSQVKTAQEPVETLLMPSRLPVTLGGLTHPPVPKCVRPKPSRTLVRKFGDSLASPILAEIREFEGRDYFGMAVFSTATIEIVSLAFISRGVEVQTEDFNAENGLGLDRVIAAESRSLVGTGKTMYRTRFSNQVKIDTGNFLEISANPVTEPVFKNGSTILESMVHLLFLLDTRGPAFPTFSDTLSVPCLGTRSQLPGRAFAVTLHRRTPATKAKLVICHARTADRLSNAFKLQTVSSL